MFIPRQLFFPLKKHLASKEISLVLGPRQSGKTTLILELKKQLDQKDQETAYFNLDRYEDQRLFSNQKNLLERIRFEFDDKKVFVFIDEIQRLKNAGLFLKGLYDYQTGHKFIVTGSGSLELKESILEPLTGRKKVFYLYSLSFEEFFLHKTQREASEIPEFFRLDSTEAERILDEYLIFGGYPKAVLARTKGEKTEILEEIYSSYIEKDVKALLGVEKDLVYQNLMRYLAAEVGTLFRKSEIARNLGLNIKTLNRYLFLLEKTFVIHQVKPYYKNTTKELTKMPKMYFLDLGLRNFILGKLSPFSQRDDKGKLFENFAFRQILDKNPIFGIWFWRTDRGTEVDFVLREKELLPIEVKAYKQKIGLVGKNMLAFMKSYEVDNGVILHMGREAKIKKANKNIQYSKIVL